MVNFFTKKTGFSASCFLFLFFPPLVWLNAAALIPVLWLLDSLAKVIYWFGTNPVPFLRTSIKHLMQYSHSIIPPFESYSSSTVSAVSRSVLSDSFWPPQTEVCQAPLSMEFSRPEYWSGWSSPSPGDLPDPGIKPGSLALQADSFLSEPSSSRHISNVTSSMESFLCVRYPFINFKISLLRGGAPYILTCIMDIQSE